MKIVILYCLAIISLSSSAFELSEEDRLRLLNDPDESEAVQLESHEQEQGGEV